MKYRCQTRLRRGSFFFVCFVVYFGLFVGLTLLTDKDDEIVLAFLLEFGRLGFVLFELHGQLLNLEARVDDL